MAIRVLAIDVHGTLLRWPAGRVRAHEVQRFLADYGIEISYQAFEAARAAVFAFDTPKREITCWTDFLALLFGRMDLLVPLDLIVALANLHESREEMDLLPDALPALQAAKAAGLVTCAFTTLPAFLLGRHAGELRRLLDHYFNCSTVGFLKGDPRYYRAITEKLGVAPNEILCVGDDPVGDCLIPGELGWRPVLLDRSGRHADAQVGQLATIRSLAELPDVLRRLPE
jgi:FMN phosphatase YigB (HAD superfamily)